MSRRCAPADRPPEATQAAPAATGAAVRAAVLAVLEARDAGKTACPSDVARTLKSTGWRALMDPVRSAAYELADEGRIDVLQRGCVVDGRTARGPIRLRLRTPEGRRERSESATADDGTANPDVTHTARHDVDAL